MSAVVKPVEQWIGYFESHFKDDQILRPEYALHPASAGGTWCKLCDGPVKGKNDAHMAQHTRDLARYRQTRRVAADTAREGAKEAARAERALEREALGGAPKQRAPRSSNLTPAKRAQNRITSLRYKINHPEKSGKENWEKGELATLHKTMEDAVAALKTIQGGTA